MTQPDRNRQRATLANRLRQMLAVLEAERQALAALDCDALVAAGQDKLALCDALGGVPGNDNGAAEIPVALDAECRALATAARRQNETNRQIRNLIAANVAARIDVLAGRGATYAVPVQTQRPRAPLSA